MITKKTIKATVPRLVCGIQTTKIFEQNLLVMNEAVEDNNKNVDIKFSAHDSFLE